MDITRKVKPNQLQHVLIRSLNLLTLYVVEVRITTSKISALPVLEKHFIVSSSEMVKFKTKYPVTKTSFTNNIGKQ